MKRSLFYPLYGFFALASALIYDNILEPLARVGDRFLTLGLNFLDDFLPFAAVAGHSDMALRPSRDVTFLTSGLHRLAQPMKMRAGDDPDDEDDDDEIDNGLKIGASGSRLNC